MVRARSAARPRSVTRVETCCTPATGSSSCARRGDRLPLADPTPARQPPLPAVPRGGVPDRPAARGRRERRPTGRTCSGSRPGRVEAETGLPWQGRAGRTLRRWLRLDEEEFFRRFYCASVTRCYPGPSPAGAATDWRPRSSARCAPTGARPSCASSAPRSSSRSGSPRRRCCSGSAVSPTRSARATCSATQSRSRSRIRRVRAAGSTTRRTARVSGRRSPTCGESWSASPGEPGSHRIAG